MMASCPPLPVILDHPQAQWGSKTYDLNPDDLNMLLNLNPKLVATGEISPIT